MPTLSDFVDDLERIRGLNDDTLIATEVGALLTVAKRFKEANPDLAVMIDVPLFGGDPPLPDPPVVLKKCYPKVRVCIDDIIAALEALGTLPDRAKRIQELENIRIVVGKMRDAHSSLSVTL